MNQGALATLDIEKAIDRIANGEVSEDIAKEFGVTGRAVRFQLSSHPSYAQAVKDQAEVIAERGVKAVLTCEDTERLPIARARADIGLRWAAARDPERWGPRQPQVVIAIGAGVESVLVDAAGALLAKLSTVAPQQCPQIEQETALDENDGATHHVIDQSDQSVKP